MKLFAFPAVLLLGCQLLAQAGSTISPAIKHLLTDPDSVTVVRLSPGYTTSVKLPEEVNSVIVGNPATFKAEHSENEPRLVFLKPITTEPTQSNALITTKSGKQISFHLISAGRRAAEANVDFVVDYEQPEPVLVESPTLSSFLIPETISVSDTASLPRETTHNPADLVAKALAQQKLIRSPHWQGKGLEGAVGDSRRENQRTILTFSIRNTSDRVMEILPPQIELSGSNSDPRKQIKTEPLPILEYRMTARRLEPGARADGVVVFERPTFKESREELKLQLADAEKVDRPLLLAFSFTPTSGGVE